MSAIVPRWEWRAFADSFGAVEETFDALSPERVEDSHEVYLLSLARDASVKVRGGKVDVKQLERVGDDGLEQWRPVLKAELPLSTNDAGSVLAALGAAAPSLARKEYTLEQLVDELVHPNADLLTVPVQKHRAHYTIGGCMAERTEIETGGRTTRTIAVESEEAAAVAKVVGELGLAAYRNVSVPRGLKALLGFGARRYAVIDVGANSVKFHVGELRADGVWHTIVDRAELTRLAEGVAETSRLGASASERTAAAIARMVDEARREGVIEIAAVATAGLRAPSNSGDFVRVVRDRCGVELEVISAEEEARLGYLAARSGLAAGHGSLLVFDSGGGSTEFTFGHACDVDERFSVGIGAVRVTERYGLDGVVAEAALASVLDAIAADLSRLDGRPKPDALVAMGGSATNLAAVKHELASYDPDVVQGTALERAEIDRQLELYRTRTAEERRGIVGLQPERADIILAGACIVRTVLTILGSDSLTVSDRGLRHGLLVERFGPSPD
jgi:exopolyphosphatase / guanosine-5'-triphosphate,3'-diphosphate pyrophosphatase